jgi:hypothetical protein
MPHVCSMSEEVSKPQAAEKAEEAGKSQGSWRLPMRSQTRLYSHAWGIFWAQEQTFYDPRLDCILILGLGICRGTRQLAHDFNWASYCGFRYCFQCSVMLSYPPRNLIWFEMRCSVKWSQWITLSFSAVVIQSFLFPYGSKRHMFRDLVFSTSS